jgi:ligand-binding SRPBCC domain-containing protein
MKHISKSIEINAPVERVFDFITTPMNLLGVWPSMAEITNVQRSADGRHSFDWVYKMAGLPFKGHSETTDVEMPVRSVVKNTGGVPSTFHWKFEKKGAGMRLAIDVDYEIPAPVIGKIAEAVVARINEHECLNLLANVKATMELSPAKNAGNEKHAGA